MIKSIRGIEEKTAGRFVNNIPKFMEFVKVAKLENKLTEKQKSIPSGQEIDNSNPVYDKSIIITGFRDKLFSEELKKLGAKEGSAVSKNTFALIVKTLEDDTSKVTKAKKLNIPIYTIGQFKEKFNL